MKDGDLALISENFFAHQKLYKSLSTYYQRRTTVRRFLGFLKGRDVEKLSQLSLKLIVDYEREKPALFQPRKKESVSGSTLKSDTANLKVFLRYLYDEGHLLTNLSCRIHGRRVRDGSPRHLSLEVIGEWFSHCDLTTPEGLRDRAFFEMAYGSGLRIGELVSLKLAAVDITESCLSLNDTKTNVGRMVPLTKVSLYHLKRYLKSGRPWFPVCPKTRDLLWLRDNAKPITTGVMHQRVRTYYRPKMSAPHTLTVHALRHSFATHLLQGGAEVRHVQELLGHSDIASTQVYTAVALTELREIHKRCHPRSCGGLDGSSASAEG